MYPCLVGAYQRFPFVFKYNNPGAELILGTGCQIWVRFQYCYLHGMLLDFSVTCLFENGIIAIHKANFLILF
jgi:hypothetical protein